MRPAGLATVEAASGAGNPWIERSSMELLRPSEASSRDEESKSCWLNSDIVTNSQSLCLPASKIKTSYCWHSSCACNWFVQCYITEYPIPNAIFMSQNALSKSFCPTDIFTCSHCSRKAMISPSDIADDWFCKCLMICSKSSDTLSDHLKNFSFILKLICLMIISKCLMIYSKSSDILSDDPKNFSRTVLQVGTNVLRALQTILSKFVFCRNRISYENFKLKLSTCAQSHAMGTRTKFQLDILTLYMILSWRQNAHF